MPPFMKDTADEPKRFSLYLRRRAEPPHNVMSFVLNLCNTAATEATVALPVDGFGK